MTRWLTCQTIHVHHVDIGVDRLQKSNSNSCLALWKTHLCLICVFFAFHLEKKSVFLLPATKMTSWNLDCGRSTPHRSQQNRSSCSFSSAWLSLLSTSLPFTSSHSSHSFWFYLPTPHPPCRRRHPPSVIPETVHTSGVRGRGGLTVTDKLRPHRESLSLLSPTASLAPVYMCSSGINNTHVTARGSKTATPSAASVLSLSLISLYLCKVERWGKFLRHSRFKLTSRWSSFITAVPALSLLYYGWHFVVSRKILSSCILLVLIATVFQS